MIYGLTDPKTIESTLSLPVIYAYKGTEQERRTKKGKDGTPYEYPIAGHDLETFFRLEVGDRRVRNLLLMGYKNDAKAQERYQNFIKSIKCKGKIPLNESSLFLSEINLYFPYDDLEKVFETYMARYSRRGDALSGLLSKCNKKFIYRKYESIVTKGGHRKKQVIDCEEKCPIANNPDDQCSNGCKETGILTFYIRELFDLGNFELCSLTVSGLTDLIGISRFLHNDIRMSRGTISRAEHSVIKTQRMLPFVLSRRLKKFNRPLFDSDGKRTGKSTPDTTYAAVLRIDSEFIIWERKYFQAQELLSLGVQPETALLEEVYETSILAPQPGAVTIWKVGEPQIEEIHQAFQKYGWTKPALSHMIRDYFQFQSFKQVHTLTKGGFDTLMNCLKSTDIQEKYGVFSVVEYQNAEIVS